MTITITDIARLAEVSLATVSRVINQPERVKEATRRRVLRVMEENNYVYNALAGGLSKSATRTLGLIIPTITNPIFAVSTGGVQYAAANRGYSLLLGSTEYEPEAEHSLVRLYLEKRVDGIVLSGSPLTERSLNYMKSRGIPYLMTWEAFDDNETPYISFNNVKAAKQAVDYLVSMGHRRIAMITGLFEETGRAHRRWRGYKESLTNWDIPYDETLVIQKGYSVASGREAARRLLKMKEPPTAIFCGNDILAYGAIAGAKDLDRRVGVDLGIIGFDDLEMSAVMDPPLTTIRIPGHEMGSMGANALIDIIEEKNQETVQYVLETDLILRSSVPKIN
ncbi:MAG: LacI family DNA-binding transcriptional regulator [Deltaproteobacteria bacterium]|jgi:DNA-binding LacI/PurR family transcriptional regulator|nr:LacI family DNA-binding transcriptional regulator [Deltaproteobacteria bacterium]MBT4644625.1 LacI family DNA-binding transcriptional regulator [Deltaproteobacteria bacterium]MBT6499815.1 LacI family DNA-binding transcriptional regulator [Deltaproteobacteria bacterium]MBT6610619.1 LacI family DNA-binding transcriptional regulator [Deltaproteobacteria bacterium]MBT7712778.1 LacI family DNA-binding transcriptional regulator [Deltaproteobacteria bacterium]